MEKDLNYNQMRQTKKFVQFHLGRALHRLGIKAPRFSGYYALYKEWNEKYLARRENAELSQREIDAILAHQVTMQKLDDRRKFYARRGIHDTNQGPAVDLVEKALQLDPTIRRAADIGCRYAVVFNELAIRHPDIEFSNLDFLPDLAAYNTDFTAPNLRYESGYPLHIIRQPGFTADLALFSFVGLMVTGRELSNYYHTLARSGVRWIVLNEPIFYPMDGRVVDPDRLHHDHAAMTWRNCLVHNYRALLTEAGYHIHYFSIAKGPASEAHTEQRLIYIIARLP